MTSRTNAFTHRRGAILAPVVVSAAFAACMLFGCGGRRELPPAPSSVGSNQVDQLVDRASSALGVPARLVMAIIQVESGGNPRAVNPSGTSEGLMQLTRGTALKYGVTDRFDPVANVEAGAHYLHDLLARYRGNVKLALAAWNLGPAAVDAEHGVPARANAFVARVLAVYQALLQR